MISDNFPSGFMCPQLRKVLWETTKHRTFNNLFVSSRLTKFTFSYDGDNIEVLADLASVMAELQVPSLQSLGITNPIPEDPILTSLTTALSSAILRCGPSLASIVVCVPLTDAAVRHIMQLPELTTLDMPNGPPDICLFPLDAFPKLESIRLSTIETLKWFPFFKANTHHTSLDWVGAAFLSSVMPFRGLEVLCLKLTCSTAGGCGFGLTDGDVEAMATALPNLVYLDLGEVCSANSCKTTVASLLIISICCKDLDYLGIHFRTENLLRDFESMSNNPCFRNSSRLSKCGLRSLFLDSAPLGAEKDYEQVARVFISIFPSVHWIKGIEPGWSMICEELRRQRGLPPASSCYRQCCRGDVQIPTCRPCGLTRQSFISACRVSSAGYRGRSMPRMSLSLMSARGTYQSISSAVFPVCPPFMCSKCSCAFNK